MDVESSHKGTELGALSWSRVSKTGQMLHETTNRKEVQIGAPAERKQSGRTEEREPATHADRGTATESGMFAIGERMSH